MNEISCVIPPRQRAISEGFQVRRSIPFAKKRMIGPFVFWDHMGPVTLTPEQPMAIGAHPHIGLSTLTYLFSGEALHRDSLGNEIIIHPSQINWMTAGKGIAHSERTHAQQPMALDGLQIWVALPKHLEQMDPEFQHVDLHELPTVEFDDHTFSIIAGQWAGKQSPVKIHSPLVCLDGIIEHEGVLHLSAPVNFEMAVYIAKGSLKIDDQVFNEGYMVAFEPGSTLNFIATKGSRLFILGGEAFNEPRHIWWNFVASDPSLIEQAKAAWAANTFEPVIHETDRIPLPES